MKRQEITVADIAKAKEKGLNFILDNMKVKGTAVIRGKDGKIKGELKLTEIKDASIDNGT